MHVHKLLILLLTGLSLGTSCAGTQRAGEPVQGVPQERMDLDPMLIKAGYGPDAVLDSSEVFNRAYEAFSARDYEEAVANYEVIIKYFEDSRFFLPSLYNAGLSYERLSRWEDAATKYTQIIEKFPEEPDAKDAYYRLAQAHEELGNFEEVVELMTVILLRPELTTFDRIEAHVRRSKALMETGSLDEAADGFRSVLNINEDAPADQRLQPNSHYLVQAYFGIGEVYHRKVLQIPLVLPPERMGADLQEKADLFMRSQSHYIKALSFHHPQWSMAAGYMIGKLYEDFYADIFQSEIPDDLTQEHIALYFDELRKTLRPLMERAIQVYEKNLSLSRRLPTAQDDNPWVISTNQQLDRLKLYLNDPITQKRAERFVLKGRSVKDMWEPVLVAQDSVDQALSRSKTSNQNEMKMP